MRLYDEIFKSEEGVCLARCILLPGGGGYFQGVKTVEDFSSERVVIRFPKRVVEVAGEDLFIKKYCEGDLRIDGRIDFVKIQNPNAQIPDGQGGHA